jgi:acyl-CoA thioester hydrolase
MNEQSFIKGENCTLNRVNYIDNFNTWESEFDFCHQVKVRFSETDMFGHLNNTVPFTYFEEARIEFFKNKGLIQDWANGYQETIMVVADLQCDYLKQVFFDEQLDIYVKANRIGNSSADLHYMAKNRKGDICFVGRGTVVQISKDTGKGVSWTEELRNMMKANNKVLA